MHPISASPFCHADSIVSTMNQPTYPTPQDFSMGKSIEAQLAAQLPAAIESGEIKITLQPKICLKTFEIYGYEVLLRWPHPTLGVIPADRWIMIAETHGLMPLLTLWLMTEVALLSTEIKHTTSFAVNVSPGCLTPEFAKSLLTIYEKNNVPASAIEIEITESTEITNYAQLSEAIDSLRSQGIKVGLDDFGVGYASMRTLMELNVDEIKIDKSIVQSTKPAARTIMKSMIALANDMGLSVVFEGIETQQHLNIAKSMGAHKGQGYLFGKPQEVPQSLLETISLTGLGFEGLGRATIKKTGAVNAPVSNSQSDNNQGLAG